MQKQVGVDPLRFKHRVKLSEEEEAASLFCISSLQLESFPLLLRTHEMIMSKLQRRLTALAFGSAGSRTSFQFKAHFLQLPQQQALRRIKTETLETSPSPLMLQRAQRKPVCCEGY